MDFTGCAVMSLFIIFTVLYRAIDSADMLTVAIVIQSNTAPFRFILSDHSQLFAGYAPTLLLFAVHPILIT